jgi:hypothetical protein
MTESATFVSALTPGNVLVIDRISRMGCMPLPWLLDERLRGIFAREASMTNA